MASRRWLNITILTALVIWTLWWFLAPTPWGTLTENWPVAITMAFGSIVAGATCEGGGAVAFPVFTKVLQVAPADARWFSLAIQSVGMSAATVTIVAMRRPVDWGAVLRAGVGGAAGILVGAAWLAPYVQPALIRLLFTMMQVGFAVTLLICYWSPHRRQFVCRASPTGDFRATAVLVIAGFAGGVISSLFGNGLDLVTFSVLTLLFRVDERNATPTTVVLMATNSLVGFAYGAMTQHYSAEVWGFWVAAIPVVVVGAPAGAIVCKFLSRSAIAGILITLIAIELLTTLWLIPLTPRLGALSLIALALFIAGYWSMSRCRWFWPDSANTIEWADT